MKENGFSAAAVKTLWDILVPFADYAFNKAHSAAYGLISYWTAYLKANYPAEYMAGLLTSVGDDKDKRPIYLAECRRMGIKVLPPDVNESSGGLHRRRHRHPLRPGLGAQRRRTTSSTSIVRAREREGRVQGLRRLHAQDRHGRLQQEGHRVAGQGRRVRLARATRGRASPRSTPRPSTRPWRSSARRPRGSSTCSAASATATAEDDPFGGALDIVIPTPTGRSPSGWSFERDMLGLYVSDHPLHGVEHVLTSHADTPIAEIKAGGVEDGANVTIAGILTAVAAAHEQAGRPWAIATLEDLESGIEVLFFPKTWAEVSEKVVRDQIVVVKGRISRRDDQPSLFASEVTIPELTEGPRGPVLVSHARGPLHAAGGGAAARGAGQPPGHDRGAAEAGQRQPRRRCCGWTRGCGCARAPR